MGYAEDVYIDNLETEIVCLRNIIKQLKYMLEHHKHSKVAAEGRFNYNGKTYSTIEEFITAVNKSMLFSKRKRKK